MHIGSEIARFLVAHDQSYKNWYALERRLMLVVATRRNVRKLAISGLFVPSAAQRISRRTARSRPSYRLR